MDLDTIKKYIGHKIYIVLKSGFKYKFFFEEKYLVDNTKLSFTGMNGEPVDFYITEISFITYSKDGGQNGK